MDFPFKYFLMPLGLIILLLIGTLILHRFKAAVATKALALTLFLLWLGSCRPLMDLIASPLELAYPAFAQQPIQHIMVLGCSHSDSDYMPITSQLDTCSLSRVTEGIRIWRQQPQALLHFSGHLSSKQLEHTELEAEFARQMGVAADKIVLHKIPENTQQEAQVLSLAIGQDTAVLVTSAMHMPRAMRWFKYYQRTPTAAPTGYMVRRPFAENGAAGWLPQVQALETLTYAQYEYLGLLQQQWLMRTPVRL